MSCDSPPLTPFQPARRRNTEIESIMGKRTYTALYMYIERRRRVHAGERERRRKISAGKRTFIDSIIDVQSEGGEWGCIHIEEEAESEAKQFG